MSHGRRRGGVPQNQQYQNQDQNGNQNGNRNGNQNRQSQNNQSQGGYKGHHPRHNGNHNSNAHNDQQNPFHPNYNGGNNRDTHHQNENHQHGNNNSNGRQSGGARGPRKHGFAYQLRPLMSVLGDIDYFRFKHRDQILARIKEMVGERGIATAAQIAVSEVIYADVNAYLKRDQNGDAIMCDCDQADEMVLPLCLRSRFADSIIMNSMFLNVLEQAHKENDDLRQENLAFRAEIDALKRKLEGVGVQFWVAQ